MKHYCKDKYRLWLDFGEAGENIHADYRMKTAVRSAVAATLAYEHFDRETEVSVTFCDNAYIKELNRKTRNKDTATDVLSFPQFEPGEARKSPLVPVPLGDIVLSLERARTQADEVGNSFLREVAFLCIHSTLHLLGYDHETSPEDEEDMCVRQRAIIATITDSRNAKDKKKS